MPLTWVEPNIFLKYRGVTIFRCYKDQDWERPLEYCFTFDICEDEECEFDIRDIPEYDSSLDRAEILRRAIDNRSPLIIKAMQEADVFSWSKTCELSPP